MSTGFTVDAEALYSLVNDPDSSAQQLESLGGLRGLAAKLQTHFSKGIQETANSEVRRERVRCFGTNTLPEAEDATFLSIVWAALEDTMLRILIVSAVISLVLGLTVRDAETGAVDYAHGWIEGAAILASVTIVTLVSSLNDYQKVQKFKELARAAPPVRVSVVRAGEVMEISDRDLLVGDVLHIVGGDVLSVDGLVLQSVALKVDESAATGENDDVAKSESGDSLVRSGSYVVEGEGSVLVTGVGVNCFAGRIALQVRAESEDTPLQEKLTELAEAIGRLGIVAATLMFVVLSCKELLDTFIWRRHGFSYKKYLDNLTTAVTIVVVAVPEGLPLSVTIALAYSMKQMFKEKNLVRHLVACETMGSATTICTDKTGTITQNEMSVTNGITADGTLFTIPSGAAFEEPADAVVGKMMPAAVSALLMEGIVLNTKATRVRGEDGGARYTGSKTEQALLNLVDRLGKDPMLLRADVIARAQDADVDSPSVAAPSWPASTSAVTTAALKAMHVYPFSSARKRMTTAIVLPAEGVVRYHTKGAAEIILAESRFGYDSAGARVALSAAHRAQLLEGIFTLSRRRQRVLALAYAEAPAPAARSAAVFAESDETLEGLTLIAIVGIRDPVRPEVPHAIAQCRGAGVTVRMITGDNKATAISIAKEVGIYGPVWFGEQCGEQGLALEGPQFRELAKSERALDRILPRLQVISRASPLDKQVLVAALMRRGEVVAVTGDGTNDAPALKNADVGFSMNSGTEVAKNASDVVIMDDNFSTIVTAMKWGRNVNDNICKFLQFQLTVNVAAVVVSFVGAFMDRRGESPLKPVQLLWINLIMDSLAALALATESPAEAVLLRPARPRNAPLITRRMWVNILAQATYQIGLQLWLLHSGFRFFGVAPDSEEHLTIIFNIFVLVQLCNEFNARILDQSLSVLTGLTRAPLFLLVVGSTFVVQVVGVQFGGALLRAVPLSAEAWAKCFYFSLVPLPLGVALRMLRLPEEAPETTDVRKSRVGMAASEESEREGQEKRSRPTLREAARRVRLQIRVVKAFKTAGDSTAH